MTEDDSKALYQHLSLGLLAVAILAASAAVAQAFGRFAYGLLLPAIRDDLGISNTFAGLIGGANVGAYLFGTMLVAYATSRFRLLAVLRTGLLLGTLGLALAAYAHSPYWLMLAVFITGIGGACVWIPAPIVAADALPASKRGLAVGALSSGIGIGVSFVSLLGGQLRAEAGDSAWSNVYGVLAVLGLFVLVLLFSLVRHRQAKPGGGAGIGGFAALVRMPGWKPFLSTYTIFGFMYYLVIGFLTTRLEDDSGWTSVDASFAFTLMGVAMIFGGPLLIAVAARLGVRRTSVLAFFLWPVAVLIVLSGISLPTLIACTTLGLLFSGIPTLMTLYVVANTTAQDYGPSFAAGTLAFGIAQMISPPIGGFVADASGSFFLVFLLSALMGALGLFASLNFVDNT
jgi:predicted MFS family arabinose efflux permease